MLQDLMVRLLDPNPETRITAADALRHPWVTGQVHGRDMSLYLGTEIEKELFGACFHGNLQVAKTLLSANYIDINAKGDWDQTCLYTACRGPRCEPAIVELLLMHGASTKVSCMDSLSFPGHALVANFVDCTNPGGGNHIPLSNFDEYFERIFKVARLFRDHHADFSSMNRYGYTPLSELLQEPSFQHAREHPNFKAFCKLISDTEIEAMVVNPDDEPTIAAAYALLRSNSKLPPPISQCISELIWSDENSSDWVDILGMTPVLARQFPLVGFMDEVIKFKAETLELKFNAKQSTPVSLVVCHWPQDLTANFEQSRVTWQWFASGGASQSWVDITDGALIEQLNHKKSSITFGQHTYQLSRSFWVEHDASDLLGQGPICGYRIRWIPRRVVASGDNDNRETRGHDDSLDSFQTAFEAALHTNGRPFRFSRVCLIGDGRAGKTALANALCDRTFVETDSTIGVGLNPHLKVMGTGIAASGVWEVLAEEFVALEQQQLNWEAAHRLAGEAEKEGRGIHELYVGNLSGVQESIILDSQSNAFSAAAQVDAQSPVSVSLQQSFVSLQPEETLSRSRVLDSTSASTLQRTRMHVSGAPVTQMDKEMIMKLKGQPEPLRINLLDFGGQDAFDNLHHLYVTRASVYLLVFNMECMIGSKSTAETRQQCIRRLSFWLNSIYLHARGPDESKQEGFSVAPVILVGTHKDKVPDPKDHESIKQILDREFDSSPLWRHVVPFHGGTVSTGRGLLNFFPVDNKRKQVDGEQVDDVVRAMQAAVQKCLEEEEYLKAKVPLQWLRAFDALMFEKEQCDVPFKHLMDVEQIASDCGLPFCGLSLQEEVLRMLKYFNDLGLLMHHDCPSLRHLVVLDTFRCLVNPASIVMCQHDIHKLPVHLEARRDCGEDYVELTARGVLNSSLLQILWKGKDTASIINEVTELMVHYGLMLPLHSSDCNRTYLVPSLFPEARLPVASSACSQFVFSFGTEKRIKMWERSGHFSAQDVTALGFCPNGLFSRLTGKIISECQRIFNFPDSKYSRHEISTTFGRLKFMVRELKEHNMIQVLVLVETPVALLENLTRLLQVSISELIPNLAFCTAVPLAGSPSDSGCLADAQFAVLSGTNGVLECSKHNRDFNAGDGSLLSGAQLHDRFGIWLPPSGLRARYDVFLSYRWTGKIEDDLTLGLFNNLSADVLGSGRGIDVFLDKRRLEDGRNFQDDFADALLKSQFPVVIMSSEALKRMAKLEAGSDIDNLLLEWTLILELLELKKFNLCLPILIGTYNQSAPTCADAISSFFADRVILADRSEIRQIDSLPDVPISSIVEKVRSLLGQHGLSETPQLSCRTVRDVVKRLSLQQGVKTWELVQEPKLLACPASSVKDEVTRAVIGHCAPKIRSILDSIEARAKYHYKTDSAPSPVPPVCASGGGGVAAVDSQSTMNLASSAQAQPSVAVQQSLLTSLSAPDVAAAIGRIAPAYLSYQQAFIDNGIDGTMLADWRGQSDEDTLKTLTTDLGIASSLHSRRVLLELKKLWALPLA